MYFPSNIIKYLVILIITPLAILCTQHTQTTSSNDLYRTIEQQDARDFMETAYDNICQDYNLNIPTDQKQNILYQTDRLISYYGDRLTRKKLLKLQRYLEQYLLFTHPTKQQKKSQRSVSLHAAEEIIIYALQDDLMHRLNIDDTMMMKAYIIHLSPQIINALYKKSYLNSDGDVVIRRQDVSKIMVTFKKKLSTIDNKLLEPIKEQLVSRYQQIVKHQPQQPYTTPPISKSLAQDVIRKVIRSRGVNPRDREKLAATILQTIERQLDARNIFLIQEIEGPAHALINQFMQNNMPSCVRCHKNIRYAHNKKIYPCGHAIHKSCLLEGLRGKLNQASPAGQHCPLCTPPLIKNAPGKTEH